MVQHVNDAFLRSEVVTLAGLPYVINQVGPSGGTDPGLVSYDEGSMGMALHLNNLKLGNVPGMRQMRVDYAADIVCLLVNSTDLTPGIAESLDNVTLPSDGTPRSAFMVVQVDLCCEVRKQTFAHELGHVLGCYHENKPPTQGAFPDSQAHLDGTSFGTILTDVGDSNNWIAYYSNPDVTFNGEPTGVLGISNNASTIKATWNIVANYMPSCWRSDPALNNCTDINKNCQVDSTEFGTVCGKQDRDGNGSRDTYEVLYGCAPDCNNNGLPDSLDIEGGGMGFCTIVPSPDCNSNGCPDDGDLMNPALYDCDLNLQIDSCEIANYLALDLNVNGKLDACGECIGDMTDGVTPGQCDGIVGIYEFLLVLAEWGPCVGCPADFIKIDAFGNDLSNDVGMPEFIWVQDFWGQCPPNSCSGGPGGIE